MTENENRKTDIFDNMTTAQLEDLVRQMPLDGVDIRYWNAVMDAYVSRSETPKSDVVSAWSDFREKYSGREPVFNDITGDSKKKRAFHPAAVRPGYRRLFRTGLAAAIIAAILLAGTVTAYAFGYDLWGAVAAWTKETFHFVSTGTGENEPSMATLPPDSELYGLQSALLDAGITETVMPTWLPEGFEVKDLEVSTEPFMLFAAYGRDDQNIIIQMSAIDPSDSKTYEKDDETVEEYVINDITHYIMSNNDQIRAVWVNSKLECSISGDLTENEMHEIIKSIYKES